MAWWHSERVQDLLVCGPDARRDSGNADRVAEEQPPIVQRPVDRQAGSSGPAHKLACLCAALVQGDGELPFRVREIALILPWGLSLDRLVVFFCAQRRVRLVVLVTWNTIVLVCRFCRNAKQGMKVTAHQGPLMASQCAPSVQSPDVQPLC